VDLTDDEPPTVREIRVDGRLQPDAEMIELFLAEPPQEIAIKVADAKNAIDMAGVRAECEGKTTWSGEAGVDLVSKKRSGREATIRIEPPKLMSFDHREALRQYTLKVTVDDLAVDDRQTVREFRFVLGPHIPEGTVFLSDQEPVKSFAHAGLKHDRNYLGGEIRLGGAPYPKGLMICPETTGGPVNYGEAVYALPPGRFQTFRAVMGIEDSAGGGSVLFAVQLRKSGGEWQTAFQSGVITQGMAPQPVSVALGDADEIRLYTDANGSIDSDHALFAAARWEP
jgi:hypothetical protein